MLCMRDESATIFDITLNFFLKPEVLHRCTVEIQPRKNINNVVYVTFSFLGSLRDAKFL